MRRSLSATNLSVLLLLTLASSIGLGQPTLQFAAPSYTVSEAAGNVSLTVQRLNDTSVAVTVDYATADGTATHELKYTATNGTLAFAAGETNRLITVPILNEGVVEGTKNFRVILSDPTGGAVLGMRTNVLVSITDNDVGVQFRYASYTAAEDVGAVRIGVVRDDDGEVPLTVDYATSDGTATNGLDYTGVTNTLAFGPTERLKFFTVPILNNRLKQADRTFKVTLSNPTGGSVRGTITTTVTIKDNDQSFQFDSATYTVAEDAGAALVTVLRGTDDTNSTFTVDLATTDGTALGGRDYVGLTNTLSFAPGERSKVVPIPILNNGITDGTRNFRVTLSNPTGAAALGSPAAATVVVQDNDPGLGFELSRYWVWAGADAITLIVVRGNDGALGPITVDYATADGTAQAGRDYQALSGTLEFKEHETVKSLTIPVLPGALAASSRTFSVTLSNATGGAALGTSTTTVTLKKNYATLAPPFDAKLAMRREQGVNVLTWTGGGQLQRADRVKGPWQTLAANQAYQVTGPWRELATNQGPYAVAPPIPAAFYRVAPPRPVNCYVPSSYDGHTPVPLVILLHATGDTGAGMEAGWPFTPVAESRGFLYCYPDGGLNWPSGGKAWNQFFEESDPVVEIGGSYVDDVAYLASLIEEVGRRFALDRKRVYLVGGSGGAFMCDRMAVSRADLIAGIASNSGALEFDFIQHPPSEPVNILHLNGTADPGVQYWGGTVTIALGLALGVEWPANWTWRPSVPQTMQIWAGYNGASGPVTDPAPTLDLTTDLAGLDTVVTRYTTAPPGGAVELWAVVGGAHGLGTPSPQQQGRIIDWLLAHPKP